MMLAACDSDEKVETMTINLTTKNVIAETRSAAQDLQLTQFASGQSVGIFLVENVSGTPTLTGSNVTSYAQPLSYTADGSGNLNNAQTWPVSGNGLFIYGIYPANAATAYNATDVEFSVQANQSTDANYMASDLMTGAPAANPVARTGSTVPLTFTHRTAKVTINPHDADNGNVMQAAATVTLKNLSGVNSGTTITPKKNSDNSFTAIIAPQSIAASTVFATIGYSGITWDYKPGATTFAAANAYTYNVSWSRVITYTAPTLRTGLTFNGNQSNVSGSAQNLVNAGSVTHGTIYYSTNGGSNWSTSLPQGTNAGTYTVHYKVVPYTGYSGGVGSTSLGSTTIAKANGWVTLSSYSSSGWGSTGKKNVTITVTHHGGTLSYTKLRPQWI